MNQSWGNRHLVIDSDSWDRVKYILYKSKLTSMSYDSIIQNVKNSILFLDPPYVSREICYNHGFDLNQFLNIIKQLDNSNFIMYTDIENEHSDELLNLGWSKISTKTMRSIRPSGNSEITGQEVLYYNRKD
jgi:site-specific DNA-adenine methylase